MWPWSHPSKLSIECLDSIFHSLTDLFNFSPASVIFPQCFKSALVTPILKKRCHDLNDLNNYRPDSNLCFIAKILEKLVLSQVSSYLISKKSLKYFSISISSWSQHCSSSSDSRWWSVPFSWQRQHVCSSFAWLFFNSWHSWSFYL